MAIDTSIYGNQQHFEAPSITDSLIKGANLSSIALKNQATQQNMSNEQRSADMAAHLQKASTFGNALQGISGLPPEQRAQAYGQVRNQLIQGGVIKPEDAPEQYDDGYYKSTLARYQQSAPAIENQLKQAQAKNLGAEAAKTESETIKRRPVQGDQNSPSQDPAQLVSQYVPREHQDKVFQEIKSAQDTKNLSPKILDAFERGSSRNPIIAAQGQREFEGLINTTVKDTEGTVRQAAMDSIHRTMTPSGLTASPGENEAKKRTMLNYLSSKSSAPIAKGYGIDLGKYDSTAPVPYSAPAVDKSPGLVDTLMGKVKPTTAMAAPPPIRPGTEEGGHVFMGGDPADPKSWKKTR